MCYSARVYSEYRLFQRQFGADLDIDSYVAAFHPGETRQPRRRAPAPRAMIREMIEIGPPELRAALLAQDHAEAAALEQEVFKQRRRVADAQRVLETKTTKKATEDVRIGTANAKKAMRRLEVLKGTRDDGGRIFPGTYCPVMVWEGGRRVVRAMRYQCRPAGKPAYYDRRFPGTYNARRDNLERFWGGLFGVSHGIMVATQFYEHVTGPDGTSRELEFEPRDGEPMLIACLWSHWTDPNGIEPALLSFAAITDEPEPEVAAAGHDRTIINIKPEHLDAWLNPTPGDLAALYAIFDDKRHPYYEHRQAA